MGLGEWLYEAIALSLTPLYLTNKLYSSHLPSRLGKPPSRGLGKPPWPTISIIFNDTSSPVWYTVPIRCRAIILVDAKVRNPNKEGSS